jgi:hypothetical protein
MQVLKTTPVLTREQELDLFRRYNYLKHLAATERHQIKLSKVSATVLARLEEYLEQAEQIRAARRGEPATAVKCRKHTSDAANSIWSAHRAIQA